MHRIKNNPESLMVVPEELLSEEFYFAIVKKKGIVLEHISEQKKTEKLCLAALEWNDLAREYIPENLKVKVIPGYIISLTNAEIDIINTWAKDKCDHKEFESIEIDNKIGRKGKDFIIDNSTKSKLKNISFFADSFCRILDVNFNEDNTKAILYYYMYGFCFVTSFMKENNIWKKQITEFGGSHKLHI